MTGGQQEREAVALPRLRTRAATHFNRLIAEVEASVQCEWLIPYAHYSATFSRSDELR